MSLKRDLLALYGIPIILYAGLYWGCRDEVAEFFSGGSAIRHPVDPCAAPLRANARQQVQWAGHEFTLPFSAAVNASRARLDADETFGGCEFIPDQGHLSLQRLTPATDNAFEAQAASTCSLSEDRCWSVQAGEYTVSCLRSGGIPDPSVPWTPSAVCRVPKAGLRFLWRGEDARYLEIYQAVLAGFGQVAGTSRTGEARP